MCIQSFQPSVRQALKFYVYRLIDPRTGHTFYVGKGKDNRVFAHVNRELHLREDEDEDEVSLKYQTIRKITEAGLEVIHVIHRHNMDEDTAYAVEAALIDAYPGLSNRAGGHGSADYGPMNAAQIACVYSLKTLGADFEDYRCLIIKIRQQTVDDCNGSVYEAVRSAWRLAPARAEQADCVLAVINGEVRGVFTAERWYRSTEENVAKYGGTVNPDRYSFTGAEAPAALRDRYSNTLIPEQYRRPSAANPVQYTYTI